MKKTIISLLVLGFVIVAAYAVQNYTITVADANAPILTNRVVFLNNAHGTSYTVPLAIQVYGTPKLLTDFPNVVQAERQRITRVVMTAYFAASTQDKDAVNTTLAIDP